MNSPKLLKLSLLVVFLGWLVLWVMVPTKLYKKEWTPKLYARLQFFRHASGGPSHVKTAASNLVLLGFPIVLIAVGGAFYLHWLKSQAQNFREKKTSKTRHVAVMPTLGIVTVTEFLFLVCFIVLLMWSMGNYIYTSYTGHLHTDRPDMPIWMSKFRSFALRLGYVGHICVAFLFFPVARGSSILPLFGLTSESSIKYHIWLGHISMGLFTAHTVGFLVYWAFMLKDIKAQMAEWSAEWVSNVAGEIAIAFALIMWVTSMKTVRKKMFEVFFYTHHLYGVYLFFYLLHVGSHFFATILPGIFLFLIDRCLRFLQSQTKVKLVSSRIMPNGCFELNFAKTKGKSSSFFHLFFPTNVCRTAGLVYNPTSTLFVKVPRASSLQWHPFTVTSNSSLEDDTLSVVIWSLGSWSSKVLRELKADHLEVSVEGPYGPAACDILNHEMLVFVSGGSGITPFISIFREIIFRSRDSKSVIPKVLLICAMKTSADLSALNLILPLGPMGFDPTKIDLQIKAYITRETEEENQKGKFGKQEFIEYKTVSSESPVAPVLGPNSWLWLGVIITASFGMFLLVINMVYRFHIIEKKNYHFSYYVLWDVFLLLASVMVVASALFYTQKAGIKRQQVQSMKGATPGSSPGNDVSQGPSEEVESFQSEYISQATNVHYGGRPDLAAELLSIMEKDVGVVACGPRQLMHDVARICSSSQKSNLHFEAISFNW